jgi:hypothetical protein
MVERRSWNCDAVVLAPVSSATPVSMWNPALKPPPKFSVPRNARRLVELLPLTIDLKLPEPVLLTLQPAASATPLRLTVLCAMALQAARAKLLNKVAFLMPVSVLMG